ncbi:MAG: dTMP kinase [Acidimicrobiales bacterium]
MTSRQRTDLRFVAFEGPDGVGKTTQIQLLADHLRSQGLVVVVTREPGGTAVGEQIREVLVRASQLGVESELLLLLAARLEHLRLLILPALRRGEVVLTDRYSGSTLAYQGVTRGLGIEFVLRISAMFEDLIEPDLTIYLDAEHPQRDFRFDRHDQFEREGIEKWRTVRDAYRLCAERFQWRVVSAEGARARIAEEIARFVDARFVLDSEA